MKFLLDQDVYMATVRFLTELGHDVVRVSEIGLFKAADTDLLREAHAQDRIFVTKDRDFGNLVFVEKLEAGVITCAYFPRLKTQHMQNSNECCLCTPRKP